MGRQRSMMLLVTGHMLCEPCWWIDIGGNYEGFVFLFCFVFLDSLWRLASVGFMPRWYVTATCLLLQIWVNFIFLPLVKGNDLVP